MNCSLLFGIMPEGSRHPETFSVDTLIASVRLSPVEAGNNLGSRRSEAEAEAVQDLVLLRCL